MKRTINRWGLLATAVAFAITGALSGSSGWDPFDGIDRYSKGAFRRFDQGPIGYFACPRYRKREERVKVTKEVSPAAIDTAVREALRAKVSDLRLCYVFVFNRLPDVDDSGELTIRVEASGAVSSAMVLHASPANTRLESCWVERAKKWHLPATASGGSETLELPFSMGGETIAQGRLAPLLTPGESSVRDLAVGLR